MVRVGSLWRRGSQTGTLNNNAEGKNQHAPSPPDHLIRTHVTKLWSMGRSDVEIVRVIKAKLRKLHLPVEYGLSAKTIQRRRKTWGLLSTRQQKHTKASIEAPIQEIRSRFPFKGAEGIRKTLLSTYKMHVSRALITEYLKETEPDAIKERRYPSRFKRRRFYAAGVNDVWAQDQHDKWGKKFGLWFHIGLDTFPGKILWLKVWWTNSNPRLITKFYLDTCRQIEGVPVLTQSDPGTENNGVANAQTTIRHTLDPSLSDTLQHRYCRKTKNIKPEAAWSLFRRDFIPGFEQILEQGLLTDIYDPDNTLQNLVFRWIAIPWIQAEVDDWVFERNHSCVRADKHKVLPHGIPEMITEDPEFFGARNFKIEVKKDLFDAMEAQYAPSNHPVFQLVPPVFDEMAENFYQELGNPDVTFANLWDVYQALLSKFEQFTADGDSGLDLANILDVRHELEETVTSEVIDILPGMKEYNIEEARSSVDNPWESDANVIEMDLEDHEVPEGVQDSASEGIPNGTLYVEITRTD